jgi:hypothetical protein
MFGNDTVSYDLTPIAWNNYDAFLENLASRPGVKKICEIGGGSNPALSLAFITKHHLEYTILDISESELNKAPEGYIKLVGDITHPHFSPDNHYHLIFSKMLAEHVMDAASFHKNVFNLLDSGGMAFHFFPTLYSLPFVINKYLPETLSGNLLRLFFKERNNEGHHGKFPAYYNMCRGPTKNQIKKLEEVGYLIEKYIGFFGHGYFEKIPLVRTLSNLLPRLLRSHPNPWLTSYAYVLLSKP